MEMVPLVSVVAPVYNVDRYLETCINSVLVQSYTNIELLLIDDGSTDNSGRICDEYALRDIRIRVFHKENGGPSSARNFGVDKAKGEYIIFMDSDDFWIREDALFHLVETIKSNQLDVLRGEYVRVDEEGNVYQKSSTALYSKQEIIGKDYFGSYEMMVKAIQGEYFSWLFLFKRTLFDDICFDETKMSQEDIDFAARLFCKNFRCGYLPLPFYAYRQRTHSSIISTPRLTNLYNSFALCSVFWNSISKLEDKRLEVEYIYNGIMMYYWTLETAASDVFYSRFEEIQKQADLQRLRKEAKEWMRKVPNKSFPLQFYISPRNGVRLFRLRWMVGKTLRKIHLIK